MAASRAEPTPMASLQKDLGRMKGATLSAAVEDADRIVALLEAARDQVANGKELDHGLSVWRDTLRLTYGGVYLQPRTSTQRA